MHRGPSPLQWTLTHPGLRDSTSRAWTFSHPHCSHLGLSHPHPGWSPASRLAPSSNGLLCWAFVIPSTPGIPGPLLSLHSCAPPRPPPLPHLFQAISSEPEPPPLTPVLCQPPLSHNTAGLSGGMHRTSLGWHRSHPLFVFVFLIWLRWVLVVGVGSLVVACQILSCSSWGP